MSKKLQLFNGRAYCCQKSGDPIWDGVEYNSYQHAYVAAYSRADARRVIAEYCGHLPPDSEISVYWNKGAWGRTMDGITPERGLWIKVGDKPLTRVV